MNIQGRYAPLGYQQITCDIAKSLTVPPGASAAIIVAETQALRWRDDGAAPTSGVGMPIAVGGALEYSGNLNAVQIIAQASGGVANVSYYRIAG